MTRLPPAWRLLVIVGVIVAALFVLRTGAQPLQPYGSNSAEYIEHAVRLEVLQHWRAHAGSLWSYLVAVDDTIVTHPAGLHVLTNLLPGTAAEAVLWTGLPWLLLLALGVGACGAALRPGGFAPAATAALLVPAALGAATRYHYDLPMTALLWLATAALLHAPRRLPWAPVAGALFALAALVKWTALPFGALMGVGALASMRATGRRRVVVAALCVAVLGAVLGPYLSQAETSFSSGSMAVDTGDRIGEGWAGLNLVASLADRVVGQLLHPEPARWAWYPLALVVSVLGPLTSLALVPPLAGWWRRRRPGAGLIGWVVLGQLALLTFGLRVLDERFALTLAPAVALAASLGAPALRRPVLLACVGAALLVHGEFHLSPAGPHNAPHQLFADADVAPITARGPFLGNSFEQRGWAARASTRAPRANARDALWAAIDGCGVDRVGFVEGIDELGDTWWLRYRTRLAQLRGERTADLLVLSHGTMGPLRFWWPDPDTELESHRHEELGFSLDRLPEQGLPPDATEAEIAANLRALGFRRAALDAFRPTVAITRVPAPPDSPLDERWRPLTTVDAGEPVALYGLGRRPCRITERPPAP